MDSVFLDALNKLLSNVVEGFRELKECQHLTAGASMETYRLLIDADGGEIQFAFRRCQPTSSQDSASTLGQLGLATEAKLLQLAHNAGIPVPGLSYVLQDSDELGEGFLMQWLNGETLGQRIVRSDALAEVRPKLARQCGEVLARLHAIELDDETKGDLPTVSPTTLVQETWDSYKALNTSQPMIDFTARWLLENIPDNSREALVHGDFRNGNLMVDKTGIVAVLDWELAQIGDPVRDLGWLCVDSWRFGKADLPVGGFGTIEELLAGYNEESTTPVSMEELRFWQVFGSFWWSVTTLNMAATWRTGETPSLERPVIGRRSSEAQMDCVNLIIPGSFKLPKEVKLDEGTQLPMPAELMEGVRSFLKDEVATGDNKRFVFMAKVAANSLGIAQREFLHGPELGHAERKRLINILGEVSTTVADNTLDQLRRQLTNELRSGLSLDTSGLYSHLRLTVAGQLSIDQPHYPALRKAGSCG